MLRAAAILPAALCLPLLAGQGGTPPPLTLDPGLYAEALREVQGLPVSQDSPAPQAGAPAAQEAASPAELPAGPAAPVAGVADWQAAMRDAGTELADVRLLALLQRLNPLDPLAARAEDYAAALRLHRLMLAGNARACLQLAAACRQGAFESGLLFIRSEELALVLERRASAFQLPQPVLPQPALPQPRDAAQQGASS